MLLHHAKKWQPEEMEAKLIMNCGQSSDIDSCKQEDSFNELDMRHMCT